MGREVRGWGRRGPGGQVSAYVPEVASLSQNLPTGRRIATAVAMSALRILVPVKRVIDYVVRLMPMYRGCR